MFHFLYYVAWFCWDAEHFFQNIKYGQILISWLPQALCISFLLFCQFPLSWFSTFCFFLKLLKNTSSCITQCFAAVTEKSRIGVPAVLSADIWIQWFEDWAQNFFSMKWMCVFLHLWLVLKVLKIMGCLRLWTIRKKKSVRLLTSL